MTTKIVLIGPPGAGKTSIGKLLAKKLDRSFVDSDKAIEERTGKKITEIFAEDGEPRFRAIEREVVLELLDSENEIISLGGGSVLNEEIQRRLTKEEGVVYLQVSISNAAPRVGFNKDRPLLMLNPRQRWIQLMEERRPIYERLARLTFLTDNKKPEEVVSRLPNEYASKIDTISMKPVDVSASEIREAISRRLGVAQWLPKAVLDYVNDHNLYRS